MSINLEKPENKIKNTQFLELLNIIKLLHVMGLSESSLTTITKPFSSLSDCKVSCGSPCCQLFCGEHNHCILNIDTHEYISGSDENADKHISK